MTFPKFRQFAFLALVVLACQDESSIVPDETIDEDMILAIDFADDYLNSSKARRGSTKSITVLKYKDGKLLFDTNTDNYKGYQVLEETSITAYVEPGEYIFWYSGGGVTDLDSIDFDYDAETYLEDLPEEINPDKMWVVQVPENYDPAHQMLKYDILYESKDDEGVIIRLDPKIQVHDRDADVDGD